MPEQKPKPEDLVQDISHKLHGCSLYKLLCQSLADQDIVKPKEYLTAALQNFALTLIITWTITLLVNPEAVKDHPAKQIIGADNPCFGWDYPPASYVAMFMCTSHGAGHILKMHARSCSPAMGGAIMRSEIRTFFYLGLGYCIEFMAAALDRRSCAESLHRG